MTDDHGKGHTTSVPLRLRLTDANDNPPTFRSKKYRAIIDEGVDTFEPELRVQARDRDKTSKVTYSIIEGNKLGIFRIDSNSGEITISKSGGAETAKLTGNIIFLSIQATDGIFSDKAVVSIVVRDVNNNAPTFAHDLYTVSIPELSPLGELTFSNLHFPSISVIRVINIGLSTFSNNFSNTWCFFVNRMSVIVISLPRPIVVNLDFFP